MAGLRDHQKAGQMELEMAVLMVQERVRSWGWHLAELQWDHQKVPQREIGMAMLMVPKKAKSWVQKKESQTQKKAMSWAFQKDYLMEKSWVLRKVW